MKTKIPAAFLIFSTFLALMAAGCSRRPSADDAQADADRPTLTVSLPPQQFILEQIAGPGYQVSCLLTGSADPESYDPTVTALVQAERSDAYFRTGNLAFEDAITRKVRRSNPSLPVIDTSEGIAPLQGTHGDGETDPHTWTSITNARTIAANMARALSSIYPAEAPQFARRLERFNLRLDSLQRAVDARLEPLRGSAFLVWHPSLGYLARDYGLRQIAIGGHEHKETSLPAMAGHLDAGASSGARVMFVQPGPDSRHATALKAHIDARTVEINPLAYDWIGQIDLISRSLAAAAPTAP